MHSLEKTVDDLHRFEGGTDRVLSLYLSTDPSSGPGRNLRAQVTAALRPLFNGLNADEVEALEAEAAVAREYVRSMGARPRGLALFSCVPAGLFHAVHLPVRPTPEARWGRRPDVLPLLAIMDEHEPAVVLLVDQREARFYGIFLDEIELLETLTAPAAGGRPVSRENAEMDGQHRQAELLRGHVRAVMEALERIAADWGADRILVGGAPDTVAELQRQLPPALRDRTRGPVGLAVNATSQEVLLRVRQRLELEERGAELLLLDRVRERTGSGHGAMGVADVVAASACAAVSCLVYAAGLRLAGGACVGCGTLHALPAPDACRACGGAVAYVDDLVDRLVDSTLAAGGRIEEVRGEAAERLASCDGIAALLRFPVARMQAAGSG
jgi:peptide subunit release factor 1 (eRF1)